ncbi:MAG: hypothetical protein JF619_09345 [Massilia sp.]|nr:hypothetical protein [Massilia sp.]
MEDPDRFHFMRGDVMVMEPHKGGKQAGHVAGYDNGAVYAVTAHKCGGDDDAEETFEVHDPDADNDGNVPIPMLKALAVDFAARTVKAFGGADRLRTEIKAQRIDFNRLSPELQEAFKPYFGADK